MNAHETITSRLQELSNEIGDGKFSLVAAHAELIIDDIEEMVAATLGMTLSSMSRVCDLIGDAKRLCIEEEARGPAQQKIAQAIALWTRARH